MSGAWEDLHGGGVLHTASATPASAPPPDQLEADWWRLWRERQRLVWALVDVENRARAMGDWGTARAARRARIGPEACAAEDRAAAERLAANAPAGDPEA